MLLICPSHHPFPHCISHSFECHGDNRTDWCSKCSRGHGGGNTSLGWVNRWCLSWRLDKEKEPALGRSDSRVFNGEEQKCKTPSGDQVGCVLPNSGAESVHRGWSEMSWRGRCGERWHGDFGVMLRKLDAFKVWWDASLCLGRRVACLFYICKRLWEVNQRREFCWREGSREISCHGINKEFLGRVNTKLCWILLRGWVRWGQKNIFWI